MKATRGSSWEVTRPHSSSSLSATHGFAASTAPRCQLATQSYRSALRNARARISAVISRLHSLAGAAAHSVSSRITISSNTGTCGIMGLHSDFYEDPMIPHSRGTFLPRQGGTLG